MFELTASNAVDYLRRQGWLGADLSCHAELLNGGVSNQVLRIYTSERLFVLKQSRPQLRTRDAWFSDLERIYREQEVMQALHAYLPSEVPEVLFVDRANYIYAMSHAPLEAEVWKTQLLAGSIDVDLGAKIGLVLGTSIRSRRTIRRNSRRFAITMCMYNCASIHSIAAYRNACRKLPPPLSRLSATC